MVQYFLELASFPFTNPQHSSEISIMLFPYVLHCFTVISAVSVLAAPLPGDSDNRIQLFDFNKAHDEEYHKRGRTVANILSEKGKKLARGNWLRKAHPKDVRQLPKVRTESVSIGDFLSLGKVESEFGMFYCDQNRGARDLAEEVLAEKGQPYVENLPNSKKATLLVPGLELAKANRMIGIWQSVTVREPGIYIAIFKRITFDYDLHLFIRELTPPEVASIEHIEKIHLALHSPQLLDR